MIVFCVGKGMRGHYAMCVDDVTNECIQTGIGSYETPEEAAEEAVDWAECECYPVQAAKLRQQYHL